MKLLRQDQYIPYNSNLEVYYSTNDDFVCFKIVSINRVTNERIEYTLPKPFPFSSTADLKEVTSDATELLLISSEPTSKTRL